MAGSQFGGWRDGRVNKRGETSCWLVLVGTVVVVIGRDHCLKKSGRMYRHPTLNREDTQKQTGSHSDFENVVANEQSESGTNNRK